MRWPPAHPGPVDLWRIARTNQDTNVDVRQFQRLELGPDAGKRHRQILVDIVGQRLERRNVDHQRLIGQWVLDTTAYQVIDRGKEGSQGLAGPGRRGDQHVPFRLNLRPGTSLRLRRSGKLLTEPGIDGRMK